MSEIADLRRRLDELRRDIDKVARLDVAPSPSSITIFSGTPVAGNVAGFTGAGTVADAGYGTVNVPRINVSNVFAGNQNFSGSVAIGGTAAPMAPLTVGVPEATVAAGAAMGVFSAGASFMVFRNKTHDIEGVLGATTDRGYVGTFTNHPFSILVNNATFAFNISTSPYRVGIGTESTTAKLHILESTLGNEVLRLQSIATNDDPTDQWFHGRAATTNNTATTTNTIAIAASNTYFIEVEAIARRTGGSAGAADDAGVRVLSRVFKTVAGVVTDVGIVINDGAGDLNTAGAVALLTISGTNVLVQVQGVTNYNITWHTFVRVRKVGT